MFLGVIVLALFVQAPSQSCADLSSCKQAALEARERKDYEAFHDLAWLTLRKGKPDDPELMLLLARAQSLSGRPGDAIVMLDRLAARGSPTDVATSEDFEAVRRHPRWNPAGTSTVPIVETAKAPGIATAKTPDVSAEARSAKAEATKPPAIAPKPPDLSPEARSPKPEASKAPLVSSPKPSAAKTESAKTPAAKTPSTVAFTTLLSPSALAYDAVSKRYLIADRQARRIAVVDENTGTVSTLVGENARLGEIDGIAIDPRQGDLWVVTSSGDDMSLSRLQLISGRELSAVRISGVRGRIGGVAFVRGAGLVVSDRFGDIYKLTPAGHGEKVGSLEYVPTALGADGEGILYVTAGTPRIARFSVTPFRRLSVVDLESAPPAGLPFAVVRDTIHLVVAAGGGYEVHVIKK